MGEKITNTGFNNLMSFSYPSFVADMNFTNINPFTAQNLGLNFQTPTTNYNELLTKALETNNIYMQNIMAKNMALLQQYLTNQKQNGTGAGTVSNVPEYVIEEDPSKISYDPKELEAKWSKKKPDLTDKFYEEVVKIAKEIKCNPDALMALMNAESGIKADIKNPDSDSTATGLIQFTEDTAKMLGTTTAALKKMTPENQLKYVKKYLKHWKREAGLGKSDFVDSGTLYALVFLPGRAGQEKLTSSNEKYYTAGENETLDYNKDGYISKAELSQRLGQFMA